MGFLDPCADRDYGRTTEHSLCFVSEVLYFTVFRSTLFWNVCNKFVWFFSAQPQSCIPYIQIGFRIWLYVSILLAVDSLDLRPKSHCSCLYFRSNSALFFFTCTFHLNFVSSVIPRYFAVFSYGICIPLMLIGKEFTIFSSVKFIWEDLVSLSLNFQRFVQR